MVEKREEKEKEKSCIKFCCVRRVLGAAVGNWGSSSWPRDTRDDLTDPPIAEPCVK